MLVLQTFDWIIGPMVMQCQSRHDGSLDAVILTYSIVYWIHVSRLHGSHELYSVVANIKPHIADDLDHRGTHVEGTISLDMNYLFKLWFHRLADWILLLDGSRCILILNFENWAFEFELKHKAQTYLNFTLRMNWMECAMRIRYSPRKNWDLTKLLSI